MSLYSAPDGDTWFGWLRPIRQDANTGEDTTYFPRDKKTDLNIWAS